MQHIGEIAQTTPGVSGADIRNLVNEAALLAARRQQDRVHHKDFIDTLEKIVLGPERPIILSDADKERVAYHEGGHAILSLVVPGADPVHRVTIVPHGQALGVTYQRPLTDRYNYPEESEIEQATNSARQMGTRWGMSDKLGMGQLAPRQNSWTGQGSGFMGDKPYSDETAKLIDMEVGASRSAMRTPSACSWNIGANSMGSLRH